MDDLISREAAMVAITERMGKVTNPCGSGEAFWEGLCIARSIVGDLPPAQPEKRTEERTETNVCDTISREAAIELATQYCTDDDGSCSKADRDIRELLDDLENLPSAQPERTCVNCGRTMNNGGWYADGRTRCPIEEHYALPKDGYCHLWEKRNVTDDDYPERREE